MLRLLFLLIFCGLFTTAQAQQRLAKARQRSYLTKVFRLSEAQTRHLYEHGLAKVRPAFFAVPVDYFPTDSVRPRPLPLGYYLVAHTEAEQLVYWLRTETDRTIEVIDNQTDLALVVRDSLGEPRPDAQVAVGGRPVPYDAATHAYRLAGAGQAGLLAVTYGGYTTFHALEQTSGQRLARQFSWRGLRQRVLYGFPLGLVLKPTRRLVYDVRRARYIHTGPVGLLRSAFSADVRGERRGQRQQKQDERWISYLALSQPRYRPTGDTLRLKARVLRRDNGRLYRQPLTLWLAGSAAPKRLATLRPVRPGSYEYVLPLGDTLGLRTDTYAQVYLETSKGKRLAEGHFRVEDYELDNAHYTLRVAEKAQRRGQPQAIFVRGTDANGLNLLDARVRLTVVPTQPPGTLPRRQVFIPDTLWTHNQALDPLSETRINLPATVLPDVDFGYTVQVTFLTADNERHQDAAFVAYRRDFGQLHLALSQDSVRLSYDSLDLARPHRATLRVRNGLGLGAPLLQREVRLPLSLPLDYRATAYDLSDAAGRSAYLGLTTENADLTLGSDRTADSVVLAVSNPHRVPFWYFVYRGDELKYRGYATEYHARLADKSLTTWHVSLHYNWGGLRTAEYSVAPPQRQLLVATDQPAVAYPGQRLKLNFTVTDERGRPVPDADLTAYAYTSKFNSAAAPALPDFSRPVVGRQSRRRFQLAGGFGDQPLGQSQRLLPWQQWRTQLGLDSLRFYQFLYPAAGAFYEYQPAPGGLTQVAPFVVDSGRVQAPVAVYVDGQPVYIHYVNQFDAYTMVADSGHHTLSIRTPTRLVTLRDVYLKPLHKLTLSIDVNQPCQELTVEKRRPDLDPSELEALRRSLVLVDNENNSAFATLRQGPRLHMLRGQGYRNSYRNGYANNGYTNYGGGYGRLQLAGPFRPDSVLLRRADGLRSKFLFEPLFAYTVRPHFLKMVCADPASFGPLNSAGWARPLPLSGFALTEADVRVNFLPLTPTEPVPLYNPGPQLSEPTSTALGQGRLELRLPPHPDTARHPLPTPRYILLTRPDQPNYLRLGRWQLLHALAPGRYRVAMLLSDSTCLVPAELAVIQPNGQTYLQLRWSDRQAAGALSRRIGRLVRARSVQVVRAEPALAPITPALQHLVPDGSWRLVRGQVVDVAHEEGLPGVTVLLKGTTVGVSTSADGSFSLRVPPGRERLAVSFVGYITEEIEIEHLSEIYVKLRESMQQLDEVIVVGYGSVKRQDITGSVSTVSGSLSGRVSGVQFNSADDVKKAILIRGMSTTGAGGPPPLLVVDGRIYTGQLADIAPTDIADIQVLKGAGATALYGTRAANGVIVIKTKGSPGQSLKGAPGTPPELPDVPTGDPRLALRRHFRDYAWWRPTLSTDAQGRAHAEVVLPDDVTSWDTFVLGSDGHRRVGSATGQLRAYKGLLAELAGPRFLVAGDRTQVLGKVLNYRPDTAQVTTTFKVGAQIIRTQTHRVSSSAIDTLTVPAPTAGADSVQITFGLQGAGGYADGEQRSIVVVPAGTRERVGTYAVVTASDTTLVLPLSPSLGEVTVRLESDALPALLSEIQHLQYYAYLCNEQAASKLLALLLERRICTVQQVAFKGDKAINFLIKKLQDGQHKTEGMWGTWPATAPSYWVSAHVLEALLGAEKAGYRVELNRPALQGYLLRELDARLSAPTTVPTVAERRRGFVTHPTPAETDDQLRLLRLLHQLGAPTDYRTYLDRIDRAQPGRRALDRYLASTELRQQLGLPFQLDTLKHYRLRTELGGVFYADTARSNTYYRYLLADRVGTTLLAYRVLRAQGGHDAELVRIRTFLLGLRGGGYWGSTYEAASIMATIGPDLLVPGGQGVMAQVRLNGAPAAREAGAITKFPFDLKLPAPEGPLTLHKTGGLPVYATAYQTRWNPTPEAAAKPFTVTTTLAGQTGRHVSLRAGQPAELVVTVEVKAEARYVLLEVPIPAGCSYGPTPQANSLEVHRENLRHQTGIFIDQLPIGKQVFRVALLPRYRGQYTLNPARAELVYFPTKYGRTGSKQVGIQ
ncbi:MAG: carboxypeptidase-like regulatory domain-containing protein [Janthinobacterium lividum]